MKDIRTILWKEWKEILFQPGGRSKYSLLIYIGIIGVLFPIQFGEHWMHSATAIAMSFMLPVFMSMSIIADSIAGERERHTLETLLASRLPDSAILLGKIGVCVSYAFLLTLLSLVLGCITFYLRYSHLPDFSISPVTALTIVLFSILATLLVDCIGVLISLWASTVKQAQQALSIGIVVLFVLPTFMINFLPHAWKQNIVRGISESSGSQVALMTGIILSVLDTLLIAYTLRRFRRANLILN